MKLIQKGLLSLLLVIISSSLYARETDPLLKSYCDAMKQLGRHCSMSYTSVCEYPDQTRQTVSGKLAIVGDNYYDSSNARMVLMNKTWLLTADHYLKQLNVLYLPEWRKQMGKEFELDISGYLLQNASLDDFSTFKISPSGKDSFKVYVKYDLDEGQMVDLVLHYARNEKVPGRYEGSFTYPVPEEDSDLPGNNAPAYIKVRFECHNISREVDMALFDDRRLIRNENGKAQMKRYNHYKMYRKSK